MDVTSIADLLSNVRLDDGTVHFVVADAPRTPYYVQASTDGTSFQVEAAGPANMPMSYRENRRRGAELERLGWPSPPDPATGNYTLVIPGRDWDPARIARMSRRLPQQRAVRKICAEGMETG